MKQKIIAVLTFVLSIAVVSAEPIPSGIIQVMDAQNSRNTESLKLALTSQEAKIRAAAAEAFASVQDESVVEDLANLLTDTTYFVRAAAAYAIGQIGNVNSVEALKKALQTETVPHVRRTIYEALGKCANPELISFIVESAKTDKGSIAQEGIAKALYRAATRKSIITDEGTKLAVSLISDNNPKDVRLYAANYLARIKKIDLAPYFEQIREAINTENNADVKIPLILSLNKVNTPEAVALLNEFLFLQGDYRYKVSAIRAMNAHPWKDVKDSVMLAALYKQANIAAEATDLISAKAEPSDVQSLLQLSAEVKTWYAKLNLLGTAYRLADDKADILDQLKKIYTNSSLLNEKAQVIYILGGDTANAEFVAAESLKHCGNIIGTNGFTALAENADAIKDNAALKAIYIDAFKKAIESHDSGLIATISETLRNDEYGFKAAWTKTAFLDEALAAIKNVKDLEGYNEFAKTVEYFTGKAVEPLSVKPQAIDWSILEGLSSQPIAIIKTNKGTFTMALYPEKSPASVANFVSLAKSGYYDGKTFHRVVPNFVVQGGCNRGDGYGSLDYVIASEFGAYYYETGSVGMASAGKDTEGTQFFITHIPTPHLDGRYSIFGKIATGMNVVHDLEMGDAIISVTLQ